MTQKSGKREQMRSRQRRERIRNSLIWGGLGLGALVVIGAIVWQGVRPRAGEEIPIMQSDHIPTDSDPGEYNSDPPTSGPHYPETLTAGFFETNNHPYPAGYLVHNLEHGYVIFWYNCATLDEAACIDLKSQIRAVMDEVNNFKVIAYPWDTLDVPVAMTSWGRLQKMQVFDASQARTFYKSNLNKSPEPGAP
ncbi:MAG: DUF3105 domain-containing protein [Chloroflexi bacterium]|nr:DUF3105 domain-containing protein [Chloroflexota bacterium]